MATLVKICGLSTEDTLEAALRVGAERVGLNFVARSSRYVSLDRAAALARQADGRTTTVALVLDADDRTLDAIVARVDPGMLQLHGAETPARVAEVRARYGRPVIKALGIARAADLAALPRFADVADEILFDAKTPPGALLPGGNGVPFDWRILAGLDPAVRYMLSGGLNPANVADAVRITGAGAVDVSSGVERAPGVKDPDLIAAFIRAARAAAPEVSNFQEHAS